MDKKMSDWITFNDKLNTKILEDDYLPLKTILINYELPIMECNLIDSYFLVTTERIISIINNSYDEVFFKDMQKLSNEYEAENYRVTNGKYPKTNIIAVKKNNNEVLIAYVDSYYPAYFSKMLISNVFSYKTLHKWFINPR
jgi:hypothetical protein